ncbi:MAG: alpha/beta hydrolase, partial [Bacteroidetes bacterium]|nr:alpha/beta hydrolase [Bacteroidota bacterium]
LLGYSMGAATAMLEAATDPKVNVVAEDSGYATLGEVVEDQVPKASGLPSVFTPGVVLAARLLIGIDVYSIRPIDAARTLAARGIPLLVIHGEADTMIPVTNGHTLAAAYGSTVESYFVPGAVHVGSYPANPEAYLSHLTAFLDRSETQNPELRTQN